MFRSLLVPLDGSVRAEQVLPIAACLARSTPATVILLQVVRPPSEFMEEVGEVVLPTLLDENEGVAGAYLDTVAHRSIFEQIATTIRVVIGHPAQGILWATHALRADLVVLCSHGETAPLPWSVGNIAQHVIQHASVPVLLLHADRFLLMKSEQAIADSIRALIPLDDSESPEDALLYALT